MTEMDPIQKTVCLVLIVAVMFIFALLAAAKNNPIYAQIFLDSMGKVADAVIGYYNTTLRFM